MPPYRLTISRIGGRTKRPSSGSICAPGACWPERWIAVLVCYLDDSGKDPQNPITTIAGYIARDTEWEGFEAAIEKWFTEFNVKVLHAKQLHDTDGDFKGWTRLRKQAFVAR